MIISFVISGISTIGYGYERIHNTSLMMQIENLKAENLNLTQMNGKLNVDYLNLSRNYTDLELKYKILESYRSWDFIPVSFESLLKLCVIGGVIYLAGCGGLSIYKYWNLSADNKTYEVLKELLKLYTDINEVIKTIPSSGSLNKMLGEMYRVELLNQSNIHLLVEMGKSSSTVLKSLTRDGVQFHIDNFVPDNPNQVLEFVDSFRGISDLIVTSMS